MSTTLFPKVAFISNCGSGQACLSHFCLTIQGVTPHSTFFQPQDPRKLSTCAEMLCRCTSNPLQSFIRSLAQVDLVAPTHITGTGRQLSGRSIQNHSTLTIPERQHTHLNTQRRRLSSQALTNKYGRRPEGGFVEFLPEAVDELTAEKTKGQISKSFDIGAVRQKCEEKYDKELLGAVADKATKSLPVTNLRSRTSHGKHDTSSKNESCLKTTFRRTKVENTSFKLHYSSPPALPNARYAEAAHPWAAERANVKFSDQGNRDDPGTVEYLNVKSSDIRKSIRDEWVPPPKETWQINKAALKAKFPEGWKPHKRLSPDALAGIRALNASMPEVYTTAALAKNFEVSPEAIRRILKSKWSPNPEEETDRAKRWFERGKKIYTEKAAAGEKPPKRWRDEGIGAGKPDWLKEKNARNKLIRAPKAPLPALITTARKREKTDPSSLADRIL
ncbi:hypothetical protein B0O99DRAFT_634980 [Bisporella sp. PMI_857]|nr:hypothetical protein B0O99DRAFT_634980 [Bisporella sp. PMI_857]